MSLELGPPDLKLQIKRFHDQFGESMNPKTALDVIQRSRKPDESDFWMCFLVYPNTIYDLCRLKEEFEKLDDGRGWRNSLLMNRIDNWNWVFRSLSYTDWEGRPYNWDSKRDAVLSGVSYVEQRWETLRPNLEKVSPPIPAIDKMIIQTSHLVVFMRSEIDSAQSQAEEAMRIYEENQQQQNACPIVGESNVEGDKNTGCLSKRLKRLLPWNHDPDEYKPQVDSYPMGGHKTVLCTVILSELAAAATTGLAAWECQPPDSTPTVDSNFWSTLSSFFIGLASLYCTIIPRLRKQEINVESPRLFYGLLILSTITVVISVPCYLYQTRGSLLLLWLSSATQLATTLQIIEGAVSKIVESKDEIVGLRAQLNRRGG